MRDLDQQLRVYFDALADELIESVGDPDEHVLPTATTRGSRRWLAAVAAALALVSGVAVLGLVLVDGGESSSDRVTPSDPERREDPAASTSDPSLTCAVNTIPVRNASVESPCLIEDFPPNTVVTFERFSALPVTTDGQGRATWTILIPCCFPEPGEVVITASGGGASASTTIAIVESADGCIDDAALQEDAAAPTSQADLAQSDALVDGAATCENLDLWVEEVEAASSLSSAESPSGRLYDSPLALAYDMCWGSPLEFGTGPNEAIVAASVCQEIWELDPYALRGPSD